MIPCEACGAELMLGDVCVHIRDGEATNLCRTCYRLRGGDPIRAPAPDAEGVRARQARDRERFREPRRA